MRVHQILLLLLATCALSACHRGPAPAISGRTIRDDLGRTLTVPRELHRLISLSPSSTEILYAIGAGDLVVGLDRFSDWPPAARAIEKVGANLNPSLERILALRPDLVFTARSANAEATTTGLTRAGVPVFVSRADRLQDIYADIEAIGVAVDRVKEAHALTASMRRELGALATVTRSEPAVKTLVVVWPDPLVVAGHASHLDDLITAAGGLNVADDSTQPFPTYSLERLLTRAPAVILVGTHSGGTPQGPFEKLTAVPAVRDHRVYPIDGDLLFRPGPRVVEGARAIAHLLHPDLALPEEPR